MSNVNPQGSGSSPAEATAQPGGESQAAQSNGSNGTDYKKLYEEANGKVEKIREFYSQYPDLVTFARKYTEDKRAADWVKSYLSGSPMASNTEEEKQVEDELEGLTEPQRKAVMRLVSKQVEEYSTPIKSELTQLKSAQVNSQIQTWRDTFNKQKGWPVDFKEVEGDVAELLRQGRAVDAEGAYKQLAADFLLKDRAQRDREIKDLKVKVSMSRASVPQQLAVRGKGERKSLADAYAEAIEELGID